MLEVQVPALLLDNPRSQLVFHLDQTKQRDLSPFIRRLGVLDLKRVKHEGNGDLKDGATLRQVKWEKPAPTTPTTTPTR